MSNLEEFIEDVRKLPCLYSRSERHYHTNEKREKIWAELSERYGFDAKRRWLSFRERYSKEKRKLEQGIPEESNKREIWPFFWNLQFLNEHLLVRPGRSSNSNKISRLEDFIKDVRDNECLYNKKCSDYAGPAEKEAIWEHLSEKYKIDAKTKFQFLRERYCRERKKEELKASEGITDAPSWPFYSLMEFLNDFISIRGPRKSLESSYREKKVTQIYMTDETPTMMFYKDDEPDDPLFKMDTEFEVVDTLNSNDVTAFENKGIKVEEDDELLNKITAIQEKLSNKAEEEDDEDWLFLRSMRVKMRKMNNAAKRKFKINMLIQADEATGEM